MAPLRFIWRTDRFLEEARKTAPGIVRSVEAHLAGGKTAWARARRLSVDYAVMEKADDCAVVAGDFGWSGSIDFDREIYLESLKRLAAVDSDIMLPGHGMIYFHKPRRRVEQALNTALMEWRWSRVDVNWMLHLPTGGPRHEVFHWTVDADWWIGRELALFTGFGLDTGRQAWRSYDWSAKLGALEG